MWFCLVAIAFAAARSSQRLAVQLYFYHVNLHCPFIVRHYPIWITCLRFLSVITCNYLMPSRHLVILSSSSPSCKTQGGNSGTHSSSRTGFVVAPTRTYIPMKPMPPTTNPPPGAPGAAVPCGRVESGRDGVDRCSRQRGRRGMSASQHRYERFTEQQHSY